MSYRVAVASSDGKYINQHFGHTRQFLIFELAPNEDFRYLETRASSPPCDGGVHDDEKLNQAVATIMDCQILLVSQIGPVASQMVKNKGLQPLAYPDFIEVALQKLHKYLFARNI